jgi:hypothetical protein
MDSLITDIQALHTAIERLAAFFAGERTRQGILARRLLGQSSADDSALENRVVREMRGETRIDGSRGGAFLPTVWLAHELMDLGHRGDEAGTVRVIGWILNQQEKPGAYGDGCSDDRHQNKACSHYLGGFFAPGPPTERVAPITLPNGKVFRAEGAARFALSCLALRAVLRAGAEARPAVERHVRSLVLLNDVWTDWDGYFAPDMVISALHALALASPPYREAIPRATLHVVRHQAEDGTWPNADFFHVIEALIAAGTTESRHAVLRAVPALIGMQRDDGTFGCIAQQERALIGLKALLMARGAVA